MPLDVIGAVSDGFDRAVARNGIMLMGLFFVVDFLNMILTGTPVNSRTPPFGGIGVFLLALGSLVLALGAFRTFAGDRTDVLERDAFRRNVGYAIINLFVGGLVFGVVVLAGFMLFLIPGIFLLVSLLFWNVYIAVEDENFIDALKASWELTKGNRWQVLGVAILLLLISLVVNAIFVIPVMVGATTTAPMLNRVLFAVPTAFSSVFTVAVIVNAYQQLNAA